MLLRMHVKTLVCILVLLGQICLGYAATGDFTMKRVAEETLSLPAENSASCLKRVSLYEMACPADVVGQHYALVLTYEDLGQSWSSVVDVFSGFSFYHERRSPLQLRDIDADGVPEVLVYTGNGTGEGDHVRIYSLNPNEQRLNLLPATDPDARAHLILDSPCEQVSFPAPGLVKVEPPLSHEKLTSEPPVVYSLENRELSRRAFEGISLEKLVSTSPQQFARRSNLIGAEVVADVSSRCFQVGYLVLNYRVHGEPIRMIAKHFPIVDSSRVRLSLHDLNNDGVPEIFLALPSSTNSGLCLHVFAMANPEQSPVDRLQQLEEETPFVKLILKKECTTFEVRDNGSLILCSVPDDPSQDPASTTTYLYKEGALLPQ